MSLNTQLHSVKQPSQKIRGIFKILGLVAIGTYLGLTVYRIPHYVREYSERGTPPEWQGPKYHHYKNGVRIV